MLHDLLDRALDDTKAWWPLRQSLPPPHEEMPLQLCLQIAAFHAAVATALAALLVLAEPASTRALFARSLPPFAVVVFACIAALRLGLARAWNRRAERLRGER